jgi:osmotically inducible lipoprotein OsmB
MRNTKYHQTIIKTITISTCVLLLSSCSGMSKTQQRTLSGAGIGAGVGAVGTVVTGGCVSCGAVVGAAVGAGGGYLYDKIEKNKE